MMKQCTVCGKKFESLSYTRKYCSIDCRKQAQNEQRRKILIKNKKIKFCLRCKTKQLINPNSHYCEECNKLVLLEQKEKHRALARKNSKKFYEENKDKPSYKYERNKRYKIYHKNRRENDPQFEIAIRLRNLLYQALKKYTQNGKAFSSRKYGIDFNQIIKHLKPFPKDIKKYHLDHIKPLSLFNLEDSNEIKEAFAPENLQWLLGSENIKKSNKF